ncbi:DUF3857 domain-containing protein [Pseudaeromonas paramecii]|uniref:DUF3857 domain-containing protein n=1 Tax=Pseudaeromonas paramecii TaxID=2138166 RepID=A0ABP8Q652_9GAMM
MLRMLRYGLCCLLGLGCHAQAAEQVQFAPTPAWVEAVSAPAPKDQAQAPGGEEYLLVDRQWQLGEQTQQFFHYVTAITSTEGLEQGSQLALDFDPSYETLTIHQVGVWRQGRWLDRLEPEELRLFQREPDLGRFLYSGRKTAYLILPDIRVGDVLDYSFSLSGYNPVMGGLFSDRVSLQWSEPVAQQQLRILLGDGRQLNSAFTPTGAHWQVQARPGWQEWRWQQTRVPAVEEEDQLPGGYTPYAEVALSEFASWQAVVAWALPLYEQAAAPSPEIQALSARLGEGLQSEDEKVMAALHFVQHEIRYLGMEDGIGSHRPRRAADTLYRRYGDCKDKAVLLLALLRAQGLDAKAALVSLDEGATLPAQLPSPYAFDHVIVTLQLAGQRYWLDGTDLNQGRSLASLGVPYYRHALVLSPQTRALTSMDGEYRLPQLELQQVSRLTADKTALDIDTHYSGALAESQRGKWQRTTPQKLARRFGDYYRRQFPGLKSLGLPQLQDDLSLNRLQVQEHYELPDGFAQVKQQGLEIYGDLLEDYLTRVSPERRQPLDLGAPRKVTQVLEYHFPEPWTINPYHAEQGNELFHFSVRVTQPNARLLRVRYEYENFTDRVPAEKLADYRQKVLSAREELSLTLGPPTQAAKENLVKGGPDGGVIGGFLDGAQRVIDAAFH